MVVKLSGEQFVAGLADGLHLLLIHDAQGMVGLGGGFFNKGQGLDHVLEIVEPHAGNGEIFDGTLGLDAVIDGFGQFPFAEGVVFDPHALREFDRAFNAGQLFGYDTQAFTDAP